MTAKNPSLKVFLQLVRSALVLSNEARSGPQIRLGLKWGQMIVSLVPLHEEQTSLG